MPMVPRQHRGLLHSALVCILPAAILTVASAQGLAAALSLDVAYLPKALAVFIAGSAAVLIGLLRHHPFDSFGAANQVTVLRGALVALMAALIGERSDTGAPLLATALSVAVVILDGVDGWFARRTRMASGLGARFDMETDAVLILVLAVLAVQYEKAGVWVLLSGMFRYLFVCAALALPWLRRPLPPSGRRKLLAIVQMIALIVVIAPFVPVAATGPVAVIGLVGLTLSFAVDILWLAQHPGAAAGAASAQ